MRCTWFSVHPQDPQPRVVRGVVGMLQGGVVCLPSDAGYVLACRAADKASVLALRRRWFDLTVLCLDVRQLARVARIDDRQFAVLRRSAPGPHTFVVTDPLALPRACWARHGTIRVQIPSHRVLRAVVACADEPLACAGAAHPDSASQPMGESGECTLRITAVLDAGLQPARASSLIDLSGEAVVPRYALAADDAPVELERRAEAHAG